MLILLKNSNTFLTLQRVKIYRFCTSTTWHLRFPDLADSRDAVIEKWLKREGESFTPQDTLCEVTLLPSELMVGVNEKRSGILAKILVPLGKKCDVDEPVALLVSDSEEYNNYLDEVRTSIKDTETLAENSEIIEENSSTIKKADTKTLLREIKRLIQEGLIDEDSEFGKKLQSCARKGNTELLSIFEASFEDCQMKKETFDTDFFLDNAKDIVEEIIQKESKGQ